MTQTLTEGWGWPGQAAKSHYFIDERSLCGRWWYTGHLDQPGTVLAPSDCLACAKLVARRQAQQASDPDA